MFDKLATKADLAYTRELLSKDIQALETRLDGKLAQLEHSMTVRMGAMISGAVLVLGAIQKLF